MQRAYQVAPRPRRDPAGAVRCGFWLAHGPADQRRAGGGRRLGRRGASGCSRTSTGDVVERGYLLILEMFRHIFGGDLDQAYALAAAGRPTTGAASATPTCSANGLNAQGRMLIYSGRVPEGLALLDEAMVGISTGDVSPIFAGEIYCSLIEACQEVSDYGRAAEWTSALTALGRRPAGTGRRSRVSARCTAARSCGPRRLPRRRSRSSTPRDRAVRRRRTRPRPPGWP